jgi:hypothetical protein
MYPKWKSPGPIGMQAHKNEKGQHVPAFLKVIGSS